MVGFIRPSAAISLHVDNISDKPKNEPTIISKVSVLFMSPSVIVIIVKCSSVLMLLANIL